VIETGTRVRQNQMRTVRPPSERLTKSFTRDLGLASLVTASITFSSGQATAAASTFANFKVGQAVLITGTNLNNGQFVVTATDASTYLTLQPPAANEGAVTATVRTS